MNKTLKVILAVIVLLAAAAVCAFIIFPKELAMAVISANKDNFGNMEQTTSDYEHYDIETPDSFRETALYGISLRLPENAERRSDEKADSGYHIFESDTDSLTVNFIDTLKTSSGVNAAYSYYGIWADELKKDLRSVSRDVELSNYGFTSFIRNFSPDDVKPRGGNVFPDIIKFATDKDVLCLYEQSWDFETDKAVGFVDFNSCEDGIYAYDLVLYDKNDHNVYRLVRIDSSNETLIWQIINSAELKTE